MPFTCLTARIPKRFTHKAYTSINNSRIRNLPDNASRWETEKIGVRITRKVQHMCCGSCRAIRLLTVSSEFLERKEFATEGTEGHRESKKWEVESKKWKVKSQKEEEPRISRITRILGGHREAAKYSLILSSLRKQGQLSIVSHHRPPTESLPWARSATLRVNSVERARFCLSTSENSSPIRYPHAVHYPFCRRRQ